MNNHENSNDHHHSEKKENVETWKDKNIKMKRNKGYFYKNSDAIYSLNHNSYDIENPEFVVIFKDYINQDEVKMDIDESSINGDIISKTPQILISEKVDDLSIIKNDFYFLKLRNYGNDCYANSVIQALISFGKEFYNQVNNKILFKLYLFNKKM